MNDQSLYIKVCNKTLVNYRLICLLICFSLFTTSQNFSRKDSLHGGFGIERTCFDVKKYDLNIRINPTEKFIKGFNEITFTIDDETQKIQLDLFENMKIEKILWNNISLKFKREFNAVFISFPNILTKKSQHTIQFYYSGKPNIAENAPWDGGFVFDKDMNGKPWIGVAVQGTGASLWYPCKDGQADEPDLGAIIRVAVPNGLMNVSNGRLINEIKEKDGYTRWDWEVKNPINNYSITVNIGDYVHFHENHNGLDMDFYVLRMNEKKAKKHFEADVKPMMNCFESKFGEYPFKEDSYKLIETSYLGMEHQSAVAYGNKYVKGYLGNDLSGTGIGMFFDYITIHETAHEWFGNSITAKDIADMWIQEGFTTYAESVFLECEKGYDSAMAYMYGIRRNIKNTKRVQGFYGVNNESSGDMYSKIANLINTLRHVLNDDDKWWWIIKNFHETNKKKIIEKKDVVDYFTKQMNMNCAPIFEHYLTKLNIPKLKVRKENNYLIYHWTDVENSFEMPIFIKHKNKKIALKPSTSEQKIEIDENFQIFDIDFMKKQFYISIMKED